MNLATAKALQFIARSFSALLRLRGQRTHSERDVAVCNARRPAPRFSVDWQASGIQCGLCWQATRDSLRHVPAGPPKSPHVENPSGIASRGTRQPAGNRRFPARRATISVEYVSQSIQTKTTRETALLNRNSLLHRAPSAGAGKNALPGGVGSLFVSKVGFGTVRRAAQCGVDRDPDSHALVTRGNQSINSDCQIARGLSKVCSTR